MLKKLIRIFVQYLYFKYILVVVGVVVVVVVVFFVAACYNLCSWFDLVLFQRFLRPPIISNNQPMDNIENKLAFFFASN